MKKSKALIFFLLGLGLTIVPVAVWAVNDPSFGLQAAGNTSGLSENKLSVSGGIPSVLGNLVGILLSLVGVFFFLLILSGGFTWMTAQGSSEKVDAAKKRMISAAIGLVIVLSAYALANYVFSEFLGGATATDGNCRNVADGAACGDNKVCQSNKCIEKCVYQYPSSGKCGSPDSCGEGNTIVAGLCPGGVENRCCVSNGEYLGATATGGNSGGGESLPSCSSKNGLCVDGGVSCPGTILDETDCGQGKKCCLESCTAQNGACVSKSSCSALGGKALSSVNCGTSEQICCQTCNTLGGACMYGSEADKCTGAKQTGFCPVGSDKQTGICCIGQTL